VLWHGAGGFVLVREIDVEDFMRNPPGPGESPQAQLIWRADFNFEKPVVAAVHGAAIGGGPQCWTHVTSCNAEKSAKFQMPFINLALVPEFGTSYSIPARIGYLRAAELIELDCLSMRSAQGNSG